MLRKVLVFAGAGVAVLLVLLIAFAYVALPLFRYLSRPRDPAQAKRNGQALSTLRDSTVLAVVAHPDDAEWYAGGTLAMLVRQRNRVVVVLGTSGEKGGNGIPNLARVREAEQGQAGRASGYSRIIFLHNPDRELASSPRLEEQLRNVFREEEPAVLLTFDAAQQAVGYRHADHIAAGEIALAVARTAPSVRKAYLFSSSSPNVLSEISPVLEVKGRAISAHKSQRMASSFARVFFGFFRFLPHTSGANLAVGSALSYPDLGVKYAEPFRLVRLSDEK